MASLPEYDDFDGSPQRARHRQLHHSHLVGRRHGLGHSPWWHTGRTIRLRYCLLDSGDSQSDRRPAVLPALPSVLPRAPPLYRHPIVRLSFVREKEKYSESNFKYSKTIFNYSESIEAGHRYLTISPNAVGQI